MTSEQVAEQKTEDVKETKAASPNVSEKLQGVLKTIEQLSVLELADLVKALEDKFGVSAAAAVAVAAPGAAAGGGGAVAEEKDSFDVVLTSSGDKKIQVIKELRAITNLGLKEAKDLVESAPKVVKEGVSKDEAEKIKKSLEAAGGKVELK